MQLTGEIEPRDLGADAARHMTHVSILVASHDQATNAPLLAGQIVGQDVQMVVKRVPDIECPSAWRLGACERSCPCSDRRYFLDG